MINPRRWQNQALRAWLDAGMRGVASVVTGGGKTVLAGLCAREFLNTNAGGVLLVIVPTQALLDQWYVALRDDFDFALHDFALWSPSATHEVSKRPRPVNIMVINTARTRAAAVRDSGRPAMLIVDECHRAGSPSNATAIQGSYSAALGLSATPRREYDDGFERYIVPALGDVIFDYNINDAAADGILAPFDLVNVRTSLLTDEEHQYNALSRRIAQAAAKVHAGKATTDGLEALLRRRARVAALASMRVPAAARLVDLHRGQRTLVFHEDISQADLLVGHLLARGHSTTAYHSRIAPAVRRENLRMFRRGIYDVLVSCRALDEGINIPEVQVAVIASATASTRQRVQRLGRVLRPAPGKSAALVYTIYCTDIEEKRLVREAERLDSARAVSWRTIRRRHG